MTTSISQDYTVIMVAPSNGYCWVQQQLTTLLLLQETSDTSLSPHLFSFKS